MSCSRAFVVGIVGCLVAGCGNAELTLRTTQADTESLTIGVLNDGSGATNRLDASVYSDGVFNVDTDDCTGHSLAPEESCSVRLTYHQTGMPQPEGTLVVDDGHGAHAMITLDVILPVPQLIVTTPTTATSVEVLEGMTADAMFFVQNPTSAPTGPITLDAGAATVVDDTCTGASLRFGQCSFSVEYAAPLGQYASVTQKVTVHADPGGSAVATATFIIDSILSSNMPMFAPSTAYIQIVHRDGITMPIGPLQLSFVEAEGTPVVDYPPFLLVAGQDMCSGQTLSGGDSGGSCACYVGLDPRLPSGGHYRATLLVQAGIEMLRVPLDAYSP